MTVAVAGRSPVAGQPTAVTEADQSLTITIPAIPTADASATAPASEPAAASAPQGVLAPQAELSDASGTATVPVTITLDSPGTFVENTDNSVTIHNAAGVAVGGFTADAAVAVTDPTHAEVRASASTTPTSANITLRLGSQALVSATWGQREGGQSLAVDATPWARHAGQAGTDATWAQLVAAVPQADTPSMHNQLTCHAIGAPDKYRWNLEPWRPDVGLLATMAASCNPT